MSAASSIGWGIVGTGHISATFAADLAHVRGARVAAVASRDPARAATFAARFGARPHVEVASLAADPAVDVVYVGTPHVRHAADTLACIAAGKAVLCEKPLAPTRDEAARMIAAARDRGVFLMEALWTRFLPAIERMDALIAEGAIGEPSLLTADFGFVGDPVAEPRLFDPAYAGGALLDVGVYPIWLALHLFGAPTAVSGARVIGPTGVDDRVGLTLTFARGALAVLSAAIRTETTSEATVFGAEGRLSLEPPWWRAGALTVHRPSAAPRGVTCPPLGTGYAHEAAEVMAALAAGRTESARLPLDTSLAILEVVEAVRRAPPA